MREGLAYFLKTVDAILCDCSRVVTKGKLIQTVVCVGVLFVVVVVYLRLATITLTSTLDGRQAACPEEEVTYTCSVTQAFLIGWTAAPFLVDNALVQFAPTDSRMLGCSNSSAIQCDDFDFLATLTSVGVVSMNGAADMTTTFRFTARAELDGTVVECSGTTSSPTPSESNIFTVAGKDSTRT